MPSCTFTELRFSGLMMPRCFLIQRPGGLSFVKPICLQEETTSGLISISLLPMTLHEGRSSVRSALFLMTFASGEIQLCSTTGL